MTQSDRTWKLGFISRLTVTGTIIVTSGNSVFAQSQIVPDKTLGSENSRVVRNADGLPVDLIQGGAKRGANLFHSFREFNVSEGRGAYFVNPAGVENIMSRVTGTNPSNILGTLGVLGNANLFLINPNGIIFGQNASLDVKGSFVASTASHFTFPNNNEFSAINPQGPPLLSVNVPMGLQYGTQQPAPIVNAGNLSVGKDLSLSGGTVTSTGQLETPAGQIAITAVSDDVRVRELTAQSVTLTANSNIITEDIDSSSFREDGGKISLISRNGSIDTTNGILDSSSFDGKGGAISLEAKNNIATGNLDSSSFSLTEDGGKISLISRNGLIDSTAGTLDSSAYAGNGGAIVLESDNSIMTANINASSDGILENSGVINLISRNGTIDTTAGTLNSSSSNGKGGVISLKSDDSIMTANIDASSDGIFGDSGSISLISRNGAIDTTAGTLDSSSSGGQGGEIALESNNNIATANINVSSDGILGDSGSISLISRNGSIDTTAGTLDSSSSDGKGGAIAFDAKNNIATGNMATGAPDSLSFSEEGGNISLLSRNGSINTTAGTLNSSSSGGKGGAIAFNAQGNIATANVNSSSSSSLGDSGSISIISRNGAIDTTAGTLDSSADSINSKGGAIAFDAKNNIVTGNLDSLSFSEEGGNISLLSHNGSINTTAGTLNSSSESGNGGTVAFNAKSNIFTGNIDSSSSFFSGGAGGSIELTSKETVSLAGSRISSKSSGLGNSGDIQIEAKSVFLSDGTQIDAGTNGVGNAGNIFVKARDVVSLADSKIASEVFFGEGGKGSIIIETGSLSLTNNSELSVFTIGKGDAGDINIYARNTVFLANSFIFGGVSIFGEGNGGDINIRTGSLFLTNNAGVLSQTQGKGDAGNIFIKADDFVLLDNSRIRSDVDSAILGTVGNGGEIHIKADSLFLTNRASLNASTNGQGNAGNIFVKADDSVLLDNSSIESNVGLQLFGARGNAGNISIETGSLSLANFSLVSSATLGQGNAGNISVQASDSVNLYGVNTDGVPGGIFTSTEQGAIRQGDDNIIFVPSRGRGNDITINTPTLRISDGNVVSARTKNAFDGGNLIVNVNTLELTSGGQILTSSFNRGNAGNITVNATDTIALSGTDPTFFERRDRSLDVANDGPASGLFARTLGAGKAGDLTIIAGQLNVEDGASVAVGSQGTGEGGNIEIQADSLTLDKDASISAATASTDGGNINLQVQDLLLLRNGSQISTTAGTAGAGGNGGDIDINSQFIIAVPVENSDISANAFEGRGGNVNITTQGIFGTQFREEPTNLSDITASSEFGVAGNVQIDAPDTDPSRRVVNLPTLTIEAEIVQACQPGDSQGQSEFIVTGRGGLPPSASEAIGTDPIGIDWVSLNPRTAEAENRDTLLAPRVEDNIQSSERDRIIEAQGWVVGSDGKVILTAQAPTVTPHIPWLPNGYCKGS